MSYNANRYTVFFAVAIKEHGAFQQPQKCGWRLAWERSNLAEWRPRAFRPRHRRGSVYSPVIRSASRTPLFCFWLFYN